MAYLSDHPLLLSLPFHDSVETLSVVRTLSSFFLQRVDAQVKELALVLGVQRPVRHYKDLLYEYARIRFTSFRIPELKKEWIENAVKENKVKELSEYPLTFDAHLYMHHATSVEMVDFLKSRSNYQHALSVCPMHSLEVTLRWLGNHSTTEEKKYVLKKYIEEDDVQKIKTLAKHLQIDVRDVRSLYAIIGSRLFQALEKNVAPPFGVPSSTMRSHEVAIHFIENGTLANLEYWVTAGIQNLELMQYLFAKGVDKNYIRSLLEDIVAENNCELLQATVAYLGLDSLAGEGYTLDYGPSREYIQLLHALGGRVLKSSMFYLVEACCLEDNDDPAFLEDTLAVYGKELIYMFNREEFSYDTVGAIIHYDNIRILAFCLKHRNDYPLEELAEYIDEDCEDSDYGAISAETYNLSSLSTYQREKLDFYLK